MNLDRMRLTPVLVLVTMIVVFAATGAFPALADGDRTIRLHNVHTKETADILYKKDGKFLPEGLKRASWLLRDWRRDEATEMDPDLIDLLWEIHAELGSKEPIHIISAYRSRETNNMLRRTVGGQASESRHVLGKAADVYFPDVPLRRLRYSALIRERGGVGYYPTSGSPFVHIDTGRVRAWPRLPRGELALLFPSGRTQHLPADGGPITREDVQVARVTQQDLAQQIAEFQALRAGRKTDPPEQRRTILASAWAPKLVTEPRPVARPAPPRVSQSDRDGLAGLAARAAASQAPADAPVSEPSSFAVASFGPAFRAPAPRPATAAALDNPKAPVQWVAAPAWDEEHPEELSYRPFAITPLIGDDDRDPLLLTELRAPDVIRALETIDQSEQSPSLRFAPGRQVLQLTAAQSFRGSAVAVDAYFARPGDR